MKRWYSWLLFSAVGISSVGAWIYLIALNVYVLEETDSPFAVSILYLLIPVATIFTNSWAGSLIDRGETKKMLITIDVCRAIGVFFLPFLTSLPVLYAVVFVLNIGSALYTVASTLYMVQLVPSNSQQVFYSIRTFIQSSGFIIGPSLAGMLLMIGSVSFAIWVNALTLCLSALIFCFLPSVSVTAEKQKISLATVRSDWKEISLFSQKNRTVAAIYSIFIGMMVFMASLDSLEASFAIQVVGLTEGGYGFAVSSAGMGIAVGSLLVTAIAKRVSANFLMTIGVVGTPVGYICFALSTHVVTAAIGCFVLCFFLAFANTGFFSYYQHNVPRQLLGRFLSIYGLFESVGVIVFTSLLAILASTESLFYLYTISSGIFLLYGISAIFFIKKKQALVTREV